jgi:hypothetical protein
MKNNLMLPELYIRPDDNVPHEDGSPMRSIGEKCMCGVHMATSGVHVNELRMKGAVGFQAIPHNGVMDAHTAHQSFGIATSLQERSVGCRG